MQLQEYLKRKFLNQLIGTVSVFAVLVFFVFLYWVFDVKDSASRPGPRVGPKSGLEILGILTFWLVVAIGVVAYCFGKYKKTQKDIFLFIKEMIGQRPLVTTVKVMPKYRFPDLYRFLKDLSDKDKGWILLKTQHYEPLQSMIAGNFYAPQNRNINSSIVKNWPVGPGREEPIPEDVFLVRPSVDVQAGVIIRIRLDPQVNWAYLEIATEDNQIANHWLELVENHFQFHSVYKNQVIQFVVASGSIEVLGNYERTSFVSLEFVDKPIVGEADIILDQDTKAVLDRCVVDFHNRREELIRHGLTGRRGVIFYGPPGTGKTFTCRYLAGKMKDATTIVVAGQALTVPKQFCELARSLQPALVVLEDVDLVYGSRERNFHATALGDLMDELDGFGQADKVIFILTTNSIDRVEDAIKDRPGRISQCVFFGQPDASLRSLYLKSLLAGYHAESVNLPKLVAGTDGASQAFLKELVFRAVQIASDDSAHPADGRVILRDPHLEDAIFQIHKNSGKSGASIMGFRGS